jgi:hypothetical protein
MFQIIMSIVLTVATALQPTATKLYLTGSAGTQAAILRGLSHFASDELSMLKAVYIADGVTTHLTEPPEMQDNPTWRIQGDNYELTCGQAWGIGWWVIVIRDIEWCNPESATVHEACHIILMFHYGISDHGPEHQQCMRQRGFEPTF